MQHFIDFSPESPQITCFQGHSASNVSSVIFHEYIGLRHKSTFLVSVRLNTYKHSYLACIDNFSFVIDSRSLMYRSIYSKSHTFYRNSTEENVFMAFSLPQLNRSILWYFHIYEAFHRFQSKITQITQFQGHSASNVSYMIFHEYIGLRHESTFLDSIRLNTCKHSYLACIDNFSFLIDSRSFMYRSIYSKSHTFYRNSTEKSVFMAFFLPQLNRSIIWYFLISGAFHRFQSIITSYHMILGRFGTKRHMHDFS